MFIEIPVVTGRIPLQPFANVRFLPAERDACPTGYIQRFDDDVSGRVALVVTRPEGAGALCARLQQGQRHVANVILGRRIGFAETQGPPGLGTNMGDTIVRAHERRLVADPRLIRRVSGVTGAKQQRYRQGGE